MIDTQRYDKNNNTIFDTVYRACVVTGNGVQQHLPVQCGGTVCIHLLHSVSSPDPLDQLGTHTCIFCRTERRHICQHPGDERTGVYHNRHVTSLDIAFLFSARRRAFHSGTLNSLSGTGNIHEVSFHGRTSLLHHDISHRGILVL